MIAFFLLCYLCNASLLHLKASILEQQENPVARLKAKVLLEKGDVVPVTDPPSATSLTGIVLLPRKKCCNPYKEPGKFGNTGCSSGAAAKCCTSGEWSCPLSDGNALCNGIRTCGPFSNACEVKCCDPFKQPGKYGNSYCFYGAGCCYDGQWSCLNPNGTYTCGGSLTTVAGSACPIKCCLPKDQPVCLYGPKCCYDGTWACGAPDGTYQCGGRSTTGPFGSQCTFPMCCDPTKEPGKNGNPICFEGHACCPTTGQWVCGEGDGSFSCSGGSACASLMETGSRLSKESPSAVLLETDPVVAGFTLVPRTQCCNPWKEPGKFGNTGCSSGSAAKCCTNGEWSCPLSDGTVVCNGIYTNCPLSSACEVKCCDPYQQPGKYGNAVCAYGAKCCYTGQWTCANSDGSYTCGGSTAPVTVSNYACPIKCCFGDEKPTDCLWGMQCCGNTGQWSCGNPDGTYQCGTVYTKGPFSSECIPKPPALISVAATELPARDLQNPSFISVSGDGTGIVLRPRIKCCNPYKEPGKYGNSGCPSGKNANCCTNGEWSCPTSDGSTVCNGIYTCGPFALACPVGCCDPFREPGKYGNPVCFYGAKCCYTGDWSCVSSSGTYTCDGAVTSATSTACPVSCCPYWNRPTCLYGPQCCYDGTWACGNPDGTYQCGGHSTKGPFGRECEPPKLMEIDSDSRSVAASHAPESPVLLEKGDVVPVDSNPTTPSLTGIVLLPRRQCCNPWTEPGKFGNAACSGGSAAKCCSNGEWSCPLSDGNVLCSGIYTNCGFSSACEDKCCDPYKEPGKYGNPVCFYGARCCYTGQWSCASSSGTYTCGALTTSHSNSACPIVCCTGGTQPTDCLYAPQCCYTGDWVCGSPDGTYQCGGSSTKGPFAPLCKVPSFMETGSVVASDAALLPKSCEGQGQQCGGITGLPCPQGSTCVDDSTDNCDPQKGGVDCGGFCKCIDCGAILCRRLPCPTWQQYTPAGQCCPQCRTCHNGGNPLATVDCSLMRCPGGYDCEGISRLRSDGTSERHGLCCKSCPVMDCFPPPNCQYINPTFDSYGCQTGCGKLNCSCGDGEEYQECGSACPATCDTPIPEVCSDRCVSGCFCKDGLLRNSDGLCVPKDRCVGCERQGQQCGGIAGLPCPQGSTCVDDPTDDCNPLKGGSDCIGVCKCTGCGGQGQKCGGTAGLPCPQGSTCVDDPTDNCDPLKGGFDCIGVCKCTGSSGSSDSVLIDTGSAAATATATEAASNVVPFPGGCGGILCRMLPCPTWQQYTPTGQCCPQCRTCRNGGNPLATVDCSRMRCPGGYECEGISKLRTDGTYERHGICCQQSCPIMDCFPPPNCQYINPTFVNGCQTGCGTLNCTCRNGAEYRECGTACPATCDNPTQEVCSDRCVSGCFCEEGLLLNSDGWCVTPAQCGGITVVDSALPDSDGVLAKSG